jgi:hypothetical protein
VHRIVEPGGRVELSRIIADGAERGELKAADSIAAARAVRVLAFLERLETTSQAG